MTYQKQEAPPFVADLHKRLQSAADEAFKDVDDYVSFTLQKTYAKCAYECFDRGRDHGDNAKCVDRCGRPVAKASNALHEEISLFQEKLYRKYMDCQDRFESKQLSSEADVSSRDLERCMEKVMKEQTKTLPRLVSRLKSRLPPDRSQN